MAVLIYLRSDAENLLLFVIKISSAIMIRRWMPLRQRDSMTTRDIAFDKLPIQP